MTKFLNAVLAAIVLLQPAWAIAGNLPAKPAAKPSSFVPHAHSGHHTYGSPVHPAILGRVKKAHHGHAPKSQASKARARQSRAHQS